VNAWGKRGREGKKKKKKGKIVPLGFGGKRRMMHTVTGKGCTSLRDLDWGRVFLHKEAERALRRRRG